ncbi:MlaA family lipoprotein, partial [uncultured Parasutterella sp.]
MKKKLLTLAAAASIALLSGCASVPNDSGKNPADPWESFNRQTFAFNQGLDFILFRPIAKGYEFVTPKPVRE